MSQVPGLPMFNQSDDGENDSMFSFLRDEDPLTPGPNDDPIPPPANDAHQGPPRGSSVASGESGGPNVGANARYVPPYQRQAKVETGDEFAMPKIEKKGDEEGVEGRHFGRLIIYCMIALTKATILALNTRFPGCFFSSKDVVNHDHPIAHIVTQVGTNFLQRMIKAGSRVLDVYGNPAACAAFNRKQSRRNNPKYMECVVNRFTSADFIREINKWGPMIDTDDTTVNWNFGPVQDLTDDYLGTFSIFQCIHTLYYMDAADIMHLLSCSKGSKILGLIHSHTKKHGTINGGEQEYWVKGGVVKQRNVKTNTVYYHPDITPLYFSEKKVAFPPGYGSVGYAWECHLVCEDTWIIEIALCDKSAVLTGFSDYEKMFKDAQDREEGAAAIFERVPVECPDILPTADGKFVRLEASNQALVDQLRLVATGKKRTGKAGQKLMIELVQTAKHLVNPGALFPTAEKMACDPGRLGDHVVKAFLADVPHETSLYAAVELLEPILSMHTRSVEGVKVPKMSMLGMMQAFRAVVQGGIAVNKVVKSKDKVGTALANLNDALDEKLWGI